MTAATSYPSKPNLLPLVLIGAVVIAAAAVWCSTNAHAIERHGEEAAEVAASFDDNGKCNKGPSVVMRATDGVKMFLCFLDQEKVQIHVQNSEGGAITDLPASQVSKPFKYLRSVFSRMQYQMERTFGFDDIPQWFWSMLEGL